MTSVQVEQVFLTESNPARVGPSPNTIDVPNVICDNLTVNTSLNGAAFAGGIVLLNAVQTLTNKTIVGGTSGNDISANKLRGVTISSVAPVDLQTLVYNAGLSQWVPTTPASSVNSITGGTGISITGTATNPIVNVANTAVVPATYTNATLTVDQQGRLTAASNGTAGLTTVATNARLTGNGTGGSPLDLAAFGTAQTKYSPKITTDTYGRVTQADYSSETDLWVWVSNPINNATVTTVTFDPALSVADFVTKLPSVNTFTTNNTFNVVVPGWYQVSAFVSFDPAAGGFRQVQIVWNQATANFTNYVAALGYMASTGAFRSPVSCSALIYASAGNTFRMNAYQNSGGASGYQAMFSIALVHA